MKSFIKSFFMCLSMFTAIPCPYMEWDEKSSRNIMKFYPVIGTIVGLIYVCTYIILSIIKCPIALKSAVLIIYPFIITGMLHLDGYCDVCDAILSRRNKEEKLRILKDSKIGAFAVGALFILFFMEYGSMFSFIQNNDISYSVIENNFSIIILLKILLQKSSITWMFLLIPIVSRSIAGYFLLSRITIKESQLGSYFKKGTNFTDINIMIIWIVLAVIVSVCIFPAKYSVVFFVMILVAKFGINKCLKEFGGVSGDVAGFILVIAECSAFVTLALI